MQGSFALMLHAHIPYCRKSGVWPAGEEWLFEALNETYLPLIRMLRRLVRDGIRPSVMIGLVPILLEQLSDPYMKGRFRSYLEDLLARADRDVARFRSEPPLLHVARYWQETLQENVETFEKDLAGDLPAALGALQKEGQIELLTSAATHGLLPLLNPDSAIFAQVKLGVETYRQHFGCNPSGFWLPECGYRPEQSHKGAPGSRRAIDAWLADEGIEYVFVESSAIERGELQQQADSSARPTTFQGYRLPSGVCAFGRDTPSCRQVWSSEGYPGDPFYLEFHAKDSQSGLRYWRVTGQQEKQVYDPETAMGRVREHARHFLTVLEQRVRDAPSAECPRGPIIVNPYDCELFGHWWHEGVSWIEQLCREMSSQSSLQRVLLGPWVRSDPQTFRSVRLGPSTWGENGDFTVWRNPEHGWIWPYLDDCGSKMEHLVAETQSAGGPAGERGQRILRQLGRELLLMQGSDWPFLLYTEQAREYANHRFHQHHQRFLKLLWAARDVNETSRLPQGELASIEDIDSPWPALDWRLFAPRPVR